MAIALVTVSKDLTRRKKKLIVQGALSGNYTPGGVPVDWTTVTNPKMISNGKVSSNPTFGEIVNAPQGYSGELIQGTTLKNWMLKIYTAPGVEMTAIAYPAGLMADPFNFEISGNVGAF